MITRVARPYVTLGALALTACATAAGRTSGPKVGPPKGSVVVVGGGGLGDDILGRFIELAGGPNALIIDVPTAGGAPTYTQDAGGAVQLRAAGAKNVVVYHTTDKKVADSDSIVALLARAGGVWFDGGRHYRLVDSYGGTKSEAGFHAVLARGGVVGGSSAGASILGSFLVRGAPSNNNAIMAYPGYLTGFGFLRGVGIDQHVVARERLPDLADSIMPKYPELLLISEDEGTAWVVQGDIGEIVGRSKAFVYGGKDANDPGSPFLTLRPGDKYDLAARRVIHRAILESPLTHTFIDSVFMAFGKTGGPAATVLVARGGKVFVNASYGVPPQRRYMPTTTMPNFELGELSIVLNEFAKAGTATGSYRQMVQRRVFGSPGMRKTVVDSVTQMFQSNVDELYRFEKVIADASRPGWIADDYKGVRREFRYGSADGKRNAWVRFPEKKAAIIILTSDPDIDAKALADRIADRLLTARAP